MAEDAGAVEPDTRANLVSVVKTPIAWFTLVVLVEEAILMAVVVNADSGQRTLLIGGILLTTLAMIGVIAFLAYARPEALGAIAAGDPADADFAREITGCWWERIFFPGGSAISLVTIISDRTRKTVRLSGVSYREDGTRAADWISEMVRLDPSNKQLAYFWRGSHQGSESAHNTFHGYGVVNFGSVGVSSELTRGHGHFWDSDGSDPKNTVVKSIEFRRASQSDAVTLGTGATAAQKGLVVAVLNEW